MTATRVAADWAWISKDLQVGIGYSVLATSRADVDFGPFVGRYVPGSPSSTVPPGAPDAPPWVTFGPVTARADDGLMTVSVREQWRERDHAGRPVWPQKLLVIRYAELAKANASYQTISRAAVGTKIPDIEHTTLPLDVDEQPLDELERIIRAYGFEQLAALAAAVLEGPVAIAGAGRLVREQRLGVLDAVAALLPYGFRADLSASSVVDNTSRHGIRLVFADFAQDDQRLLPLRGRGPDPSTERGRHYLRTLGEKQDTPGISTLVRHMWDAKGPYSFEKPGLAVTILVDLDFYEAFERDAAQGPVPVGLLRKFLADPAAAERAWARFDSPVREYSLAAYLPGCDPEAADAVISCWHFLGPDVSRLINRSLDSGGLGFAQWCLATAGPAEDRMLGDLLVPEQVVADQEARRHRAGILVDLLRQREPPPPGELPYTCNQLRYDDMTAWQACLVRDLLLRELATDGPANRGKAWAWVWWLCESAFSSRRPRPEWIAALDFVASDQPSPEAVTGVRSLIKVDARWALVLLRLASQTGCLPGLLGAAHQQLIELAARISRPLKPGSAFAHLAVELDRDLWALDVQPEAVASLDVARGLLGGEPRDFPDQAPAGVLDGYLTRVGSVLELEVVQPRQAEIEDWFLHRAVPGQVPGELTAGGVALLNAWAGDAQRRPALLGYLARLDSEAYPYHQDLSETFWDALLQHETLAGYAAGNQVTKAAKEAVRQPGAALRRPLAEDAVMSTALARACFKARRAGLPVDGMVGALARAQAGEIGAERLDDVLREFQALLFREYVSAPEAGPDPGEASEQDLFESYRLIVAGALGDPFAEVFRSHLEGRLNHEIWARQWALHNILPARRRRWVPRLRRQEPEGDHVPGP